MINLINENNRVIDNEGAKVQSYYIVHRPACFVTRRWMGVRIQNGKLPSSAPVGNFT